MGYKEANGVTNEGMNDVTRVLQVDQSELAFRMLCRRHGAELCYTPMFHSRLFAESPAYREKMFEQHVHDRPLVVQVRDVCVVSVVSVVRLELMECGGCACMGHPYTTSSAATTRRRCWQPPSSWRTTATPST